jgi:hypothetical protein
VQIIESALSDIDGSLEFLIASAAHVNQGMGSLVEVDHGDLNERIMVQSQSLDRFCQTNDLKRIDFIKVDIQGAEPLFIQGSRQTLQRFKPQLIMEVAPSSLMATSTRSNELIARMESFGYEAYLLANSGKIDTRIRAEMTAPDFTAENVLFRPSDKAKA